MIGGKKLVKVEPVEVMIWLDFVVWFKLEFAPAIEVQ